MLILLVHFVENQSRRLGTTDYVSVDENFSKSYNFVGSEINYPAFLQTCLISFHSKGHIFQIIKSKMNKILKNYLRQVGKMDKK